jgi:hypothetical protein
MLEQATGTGHRGASFQRYREKAVTAALHQQDRVELARLREKIVQARRARRGRVLAARAACRDALLAVRAKAKRAREGLRRQIAEATAQARGQCVTSRDRLAELGVKSVAASQAELHRLRADIRLRRRAEGARRLERLTKREARSESDDEVRNNIPRELEPVWRAVKDRIRAGARRTRTEAFLEWVHDNSASVTRILNQAHESDIEDLVQQEAAMYAQNPRLRMRNPTPYVVVEGPHAHAYRASSVKVMKKNPSTHARRIAFYTNMIKGAVRHGGGIGSQNAKYWRAKLAAERRHPNPRPSSRKKKRNPIVIGGTNGGNLEPGMFQWNRRGIGNPGTPKRRNPDKMAALNMMASAGYSGDPGKIMRAVDACRAAGCTREEMLRAQRHGMAHRNPRRRRNPIRLAPPGNADRYASARSGWLALSQWHPGVLPKKKRGANPSHRRAAQRGLLGHRASSSSSDAQRAQNRALALRHLRIAIKEHRAGNWRVSAATVRQVAERALRYGASKADVAALLGRGNPRRRNPITMKDLALDAVAQARTKLDGIETALNAVPASSSSTPTQSNPRRRRRTNPKARRSSSVKWWRATIYGPGGKVVHRQVARANPSTAKAAAKRLASRHGRVALDGPFAVKPAC